jgi:type VI secretion system protein ImpM
MSEGAELRELGFYGKLPSYGDFIQKRLPQDFTNPWHEWLQSGLMAIRESDPDGWLSFYLNCPAWSFVLNAGICGEQAVAGVTIPSVDKVGRYFNFTMAVMLPEGTSATTFAITHGSWMSDLCDLVISVLDEEMDQDQIENAIRERSAELSIDMANPALLDEGEDFLRVSHEFNVANDERAAHLLHQLLCARLQNYGLWWHEGSSQVSAQLVSCPELPSTGVYLKMMRHQDMAETEPGISGETDYLDELLSDEPLS